MLNWLFWLCCTTLTIVFQIRETRKAVRDSEVGVEKMAIGRHLNDRGHVVTRHRNTRTGDIDENQDYINFDECKLVAHCL